VLIGVAVLLAVFLAAEGAVRLWSPPDAQERLAAAFVARDLRLLEPCAAIESGARGEHLVALKGSGTPAFDYPLAPTPGTLRVAVIGESSGATLAGAMKEILAAAPHAAVEVLDCASRAASLEHAQLRAIEVMEYSPDVLVVSVGHDIDVRYPLDQWRLRAQYWLSRSRVLRYALATGVSAAAPRSDVAERIALLARWMHGLAREARARGITVIVQTLPANLWVPPAADRRALEDEQFLRARLEYARGSRVAAMQRLAARAAERHDPYWHFVLGTWLARSGDRKRAREHLQAAVDLSTDGPDRASSAVNEAIRRVAEEDSLVLRDTEGAVSEMARQGIPGWDVMRDHRHLKPHVLAGEAREILLLARRAVGPDKPLELPEPPAPWPTRVDMARTLGSLTSELIDTSDAYARRWAAATGYAVEQWLGLGYDNVDLAIEEYLGGPVFARVRDPVRRARLLAYIAQGYWKGGRKERALELSDRAVKSPSTEARIERALLEVGRGNVEAARELLRGALELSERTTDARFYLEQIDDRRASLR
jgi:tetratricopeptide (TPR) repeat protein